MQIDPKPATTTLACKAEHCPRRTSRERVAGRKHIREEDESDARHDRFGPERKASRKTGLACARATPRTGDVASLPSGSVMVNVSLTFT